jgi:3,4-dihydroxy 2-butanone 4-phosphate synthase / GTP cyclohydrolase II
MTKQFSTVQAAVDAVARGEVVIVVDAEDRENEGDYICAAEKATPESVNFILSGRGQFCMPILPDVCRRLELTAIVEANNTPLKTGFMTPLDHVSCRTGITAAERATTVRAMIDPASGTADFVRPGHVHPLLAKEGGVLRRAGHTEAAVDLARMAGLAPAGVLCEILNDVGGRATRDELLRIAERHRLEIISIEELIAYRRVSEKLVNRATTAKLPTAHGTFELIVYDVKYEAQHPLVLAMGDLKSVPAPLIRLHSSCFTGDLIASLRCDCGDQLQMALKMIAAEGVGVLVYLPQEGRGIGLTEKIKAYALQDTGLDTVEANHALGFKADMRDYGIGIQILKDLGLDKVRLLTNNPKKTDAFIYGGFDLEVVDQVPIVSPVNEFNSRYLATKREKLGHRLPHGVSVPIAAGATLELAGIRPAAVEESTLDQLRPILDTLADELGRLGMIADGQDAEPGASSSAADSPEASPSRGN